MSRQWQPGAKPPMIVMRSMFNKSMETRERMALNKFTMGVATQDDYALFMDMANMLVIAGTSDEGREYARIYAEDTVLPALAGIKNRWDKAGKLGLSAQERKVLIGLIEFSYQFWMRQPIDLYARCGAELLAYKKELVERTSASWPDEHRIDIIGQNGNDGLHYDK